MHTMLINPHKRGTKGKKVTVANMSEKKGKKKRSRAGKRKHSAKRTIQVMRSNPIGKRRSTRRFRKNPIGGLVDLVAPVAIGATGMLGVDVALNVLPLPYQLKVGPVRYVAKTVGAVALGFGTGAITNKGLGRRVMAAALTTVLYDAEKALLRTVAPGMALSDVEYGQLEDMADVDEYGNPLGEVYDMSPA